MSVSSHLSPEPERRLWLIHEHLRGEAERCDWKLAALAALCALEAAAAPAPARAALAAVVAVALLSLLPGARKARPLPFIDPEPGRHSVDDSLLSADDLTKYAVGDLILKLDRYLGGGITATPYYEDLVAEIARAARRAARQRRLLTAAAVLAAAAQVLLAVLALRRRSGALDRFL